MKRRSFLKKTTAGLSTLAGWSLAGSGTGMARPVLGAPPGEATPPADGVLIDVAPGLSPANATLKGGATLKLGQHPPADAYQAPEWLRYARAIYVEGYAPPIFPSVAGFDAQRIVAAARELGGDTVRFQGVGRRALFPSKVYPIYPELGTRDLVNEVSRECRKAGMHLYSYCPLENNIDAAVIADPRYAAYVSRGPDGKPYPKNPGYGNGDGFPSCGTGDAYRQMIRKVVAELCEHDIDGVYFDAPSGYRSVCFCDSCQAGFREFSGMDLRRVPSIRQSERLPNNADMKALCAWHDWANKLMEEDLADLRKSIHGSGKFMLCHNGGTWRPGSFHAQYRYADGFMVEYSDEFYQRLLRALMGSSMARPAKRMAQTYMGSYDVAAIGHPPHNHPWTPHCLNLEDGDEIRMEGFADLAGGNVPLYGVVNRLLYGIGEGSTEPAKDVFSTMRRAEPILKDSVPVSYATIVLTAESLELFRTRRRSWNVAMSEGLALAMLDEHIGFDVVPNLEMTEEWLESQRVIALCGASAITDEDAGRLAAWVKAGGGLLATYDTGLFDGQGELRQDGGALKEVLGVEMQGEAPDGHPDTFYRINTTHPALGEYRQGKVVMGDASLVRVKARPGATVLADCVNVETQETYGPAIVLNRYGKGQALYVGGSLEANYAASRTISPRRMLASMVRYLGADAPLPFHLEAPRGVYGILRRAPGGDLALWVCANVGFKDAAVGRMRQEFLPVANVEARIRVPDGKHVKSVYLVRADRSVPFTINDGYAAVKIPSVHIAELVHVALG